MPVTGAAELIASLKSRAKKAAEAKANTAVGYEAPYALYVHEDLEAQHTNGQAKFLETPLRLMRRLLLKQISTDLRRNRDLEVTLYDAGLTLLEASQVLVPVKTGQLRSSGYVRVEAKS